MCVSSIWILTFLRIEYATEDDLFSERSWTLESLEWKKKHLWIERLRIECITNLDYKFSHSICWIYM